MEPVSLGVSVVALVGLFDNALNCFKHVKVAKSFGSDYQTYVLRLQNLRLRLSRWGEAVGLGEQFAAGDQPTTSVLPDAEVKQAKELIGHIIRLFSDTEELAEKFADKHSELVAIDEDADGLGDARQLCQKMHNICIRRQRQSSAVTKARWSLYSKEKFVELVENLQFLVDDLVNLFPGETKVSIEEKLCDQEARELRDEKALPKLQALAREQDVRLAEAIAKLAQDRTTKTTAFHNHPGVKIMNQGESQKFYGSQQFRF
ncbi:hypothetical protein KC343_g2332 [Hortaea werneckii]|nr:hypothetical protein KC352_g10462 [Hortaea werneckii]KAI7569126.1 hypothetical protein KC317_g3594 [Hortaea werneckii]KAI7625163.1 hypothetical protein KC346_g1864 [Hortaea werneckii]KAI7634543.1 hypothetical protein KC343_g2332 [Hortaea werneckii]KAI7681421.1 hypothetical protein KC319_g1600 [Hortaea werneckii]